MGRYLKDMWQVAEALGRPEGRMCLVAAAHMGAPRVCAHSSLSSVVLFFAASLQWECSVGHHPTGEPNL